MTDVPANAPLHAPPGHGGQQESVPPSFDGQPAESDEPRLAKLERMVKCQWAAILIAVVIVGGLLVWQIQSTAAQAARAHAQLKLLQQVQADFGMPDHTGQSPLTDAQLYRQLRDSLTKVRQTYEPLKHFDLSHPNQNLDELLGKANASEASRDLGKNSPSAKKPDTP